MLCYRDGVTEVSLAEDKATSLLVTVDLSSSRAGAGVPASTLDGWTVLGWQLNGKGQAAPDVVSLRYRATEPV